MECYFSRSGHQTPTILILFCNSALNCSNQGQAKPLLREGLSRQHISKNPFSLSFNRLLTPLLQQSSQRSTAVLFHVSFGELGRFTQTSFAGLSAPPKPQLPLEFLSCGGQNPFCEPPSSKSGTEDILGFFPSFPHCLQGSFSSPSETKPFFHLLFLGATTVYDRKLGGSLKGPVSAAAHTGATHFPEVRRNKLLA